MKTKDRNNNVLLIQARTNPEIIVNEQENLKRIFYGTKFEFTFANPIKEDLYIDWNYPKKILEKYGKTIWLGSAEIDLSIKTEKQEIYKERVLPLAQEILKENVSTLGICLGHQTLAFAGGARIERNKDNREFGTTALRLTDKGRVDPIFNSLPNLINMVFAHNDSVVDLPSGFTLLASTIRNQFSVLKKGKIITFQGHPEITDVYKLKKRIILAQKRTNLDTLSFTYPLIDPGPTDLIIKNFLIGYN